MLFAENTFGFIITKLPPPISHNSNAVRDDGVNRCGHYLIVVGNLIISVCFPALQSAHVAACIHRFNARGVLLSRSPECD